MCSSSPNDVSHTSVTCVLHEQCLPVERRRSATGRQARKLFEGAERELLQLRLACIHPQMTAYWRNLSAEMQLDSVSTLRKVPHSVHCLLSVLWNLSGGGGGCLGMAVGGH